MGVKLDDKGTRNANPMTSKHRCQLDLCGEKTVDIPDKETLTRLIFEYAFRDDFFAILELPSGHFMQTASSDEPGRFVLEVQEGSYDDHQRCSDSSLRLDTVVAAMTSYLAGDDQWRTNLQWEPCDLEFEARQYRRSRTMWASLSVLVIGLLAFVLFRMYG